MKRPIVERILLVICLLGLPLAAAGSEEQALWPEPQRSFAQDGPAWLLPAPERLLLEEEPEAARAARIASFLADPVPATPENELVEGIRRRQALVRQEGFGYLDERSRLLFVQGPPEQRRTVDCGWVFEPLEIWRYGRVKLIVHQPAREAPWRLWLPFEGKRALYTAEMADYLDQVERYGRGRRWDRSLCPEAREVDEITGIDALTGKEDGAPTVASLRRWLDPPADLERWAAAAVATPIGEEPPPLAVSSIRVEFPRRRGQRLIARFVVELPADPAPGILEAEGARRHDLALEGRLEQGGELFDSFRVRFRPEARVDAEPLVLEAEQPLRPGATFLARFVVEDRITGARSDRALGFRVPRSPIAVEGPAGIQGEAEVEAPEIGEDALVLVPPPEEVVLGVWRAVALVTGERIAKVSFSVDGSEQLSRTQPPYTAEVRLSRFPREQVIRAEGFDRQGELVAFDEVVVNRPRGALRVRIVAPSPAEIAPGPTRVEAEIVVPEEREIRHVDFLLGEERVSRRTEPPWVAEVVIPEKTGTQFLTVAAELDDGSRAEDVLFLSRTEFGEEVGVDLVQLYATVTGRDGRPVRGLSAEDFEVREEGRPVELTRFQRVDDLPLMAGIALDLSGSMANSLVEAERAALEFLRQVITPRDRCFALGFADRPVTLMPTTNDVDAVSFSLEGLDAFGSTALYDALVHALYLFRYTEARGALVLLSDGADTSSHLAFDDALEYARRSGVVVYTVALGVGALDLPLRQKLERLARETGGRVFFVDEASELSGVYREIEEELRSQYLLVYQRQAQAGEDEYRSVEVRSKRSGLEVRAARGRY